MKKHILVLSLFTLSLAITFTACQKDNTPPEAPVEATTHSDDESRVSNEIDAVANDANLALESNIGFSGRGGGIQSLICDATIAVDTMSNPRTITITYNGTNCLGNRTRTGVIILSMAQNIRWRDAGAVITVTFQNFKITRISDNKSITINGSKSITNQSGGLLIQLASLGTITHLINSSGLAVTFDNGTQRSWQVARKHVFTFNTGAVLTISGNHTDGNVSGIAEWGTNRFGNSFTTAITDPLVIRQDCNFRLTGGQVRHDTPNFTATSTFGLDENGNPTSCPGTAAYYLKIVWSGPGGNPHTVILPY